MIGIYKIQNCINGKVYIGKSLDIERRFKHHKNSAFNDKSKCFSYPLYVDFRNYGLDNFTFSVLETCSSNELSKLETEYINRYNYQYKLYNRVLKSGASFCKISDDMLLDIITLLCDCEHTHKQIADMLFISVEVVDSINTGRLYRLDDIEYPIVDYSHLRYLQKSLDADFHCSMCGCLLKSRKNTLCLSCYNKERSKFTPDGVLKPLREELKELIRNNSFCRIGDLFDVSDNAVRKWCKNYNLPYRTKDIREIPDADWDSI